MRTYLRLALAILGLLAFAPAVAFGQASIVGVVRDTSGAVLPGVTVEAASPALIERTRSSVTDGTGQYRIENLRPGTYTVTFSLSGFSTVKREGIELRGTFAASVNSELQLGAVEETITVTGETPVVDVQNTTRQQVLDQSVIDALPSGRNAAMMAGLLPAVSIGRPNVGGITGESFATVGGLTVHGVGDVRTLVNGVSIHSAQGNGATGVGNVETYEEMVVDTSGVSAEQAEGGVRMNLIPREGGNTFRASFYGAFANSSLQGSNYSQDLQDRGLRTPDSLKEYGDLAPAFGGPILPDKLWFHVTARYNKAQTYVPIFFNTNAGNPNAWSYEPDTARGPATHYSRYKQVNGRLTWQATARNKIGLAIDYQDSCLCPSISPTIAPEAAAANYFEDYPVMLFADWTAPVTSRLLFEATAVRQDEQTLKPPHNPLLPQGAARFNPVTEQSNGLTYRASPGVAINQRNATFISRVTMSYITGAHALKIGFNYGDETQSNWNHNIDSPMSFRFNNGVPNLVTLSATPWRRRANADRRALFVQDRWTTGRWTLTGGIRYDYHHVSFPGVTIEPGEFLRNRIVLAAADGVRWHDMQPRSGVVFDVFGNGKTALKVSLNKYLAAQALPNNAATGMFTTAMVPAARLVTTANRSWNDANRNFVPDCDVLSPVANGECGPLDNPDFGSPRLGATYDPDTLTGWNKRDFNWQFSVGVQRELIPRVSAELSYFRTWFGNFAVIDDRAIGASDFDRFSITAPAHADLPGGGGYVVDGLFNLNPAKFGVPADNFITFADTYGKQSRHWDGIDVVLNARLSGDVLLSGGLSTGRTTTDNCEIVDDLPEMLFGAQNVGAANPNVWLPASNCRQPSKFLTQAKVLGTYTVPRVDVELAVTVQSMPGPLIAANYIATNAVVAPTLGRNLAGGANNVTINIVEPGTMYGERINQVDLRLGKNLRFGRTRTRLSVDLYNVLNANPVLTQNNAFAAWQRPLAILNARFAKMIVQFEF